MNFIPDAKKHLIVSIVKSALRIGAGFILMKSGVPVLFYAGGLLVIAEVLGVLEELV